MERYNDFEKAKLNKEIETLAINLKTTCKSNLDCTDCNMHLMCKLALHNYVVPCETTIDDIIGDIKNVYNEKEGH